MGRPTTPLQRWRVHFFPCMVFFVGWTPTALAFISKVSHYSLVTSRHQAAKSQVTHRSSRWLRHPETARNSEATVNGEVFVSSDGNRNIFHDYDGPIVLLGCSGEGKELQRLGESLGHSSVSVTSKLSTEEILERGYRIIVADFSDTDIEEEVAERLYEAGLLSIYINVDTRASNMGAAGERKDRLDEQIFVKYSDYELCIRDEGLEEASSASWEHLEWELTRIVARARLIPPIPGDKSRHTNTAYLTMGQHTFFLSLSFPEIQQVEPYVEQMCLDVDAMEYRTDLLDCRDSRFDLLYGMQLLRRYCRPHAVRVPALPCTGSVLEDVMPICYTVRTKGQAGTYPNDEAGINKMFDVLDWGLRGGVEVLDVESAWDADKTTALLAKAKERYSSQILGSHHVVGEEITTEGAVELFQQCQLQGRAHGAKVVLSIKNEEKDRMAYEAALISSELAAADGQPVIPSISLVLGSVGQFSRIINIPFTPVTHESLPFKAAPGQLTSSEIMTTRLLTKIFEVKKYGILGHNIGYSVSPQMHGAAFAATKLPHEYILIDLATVEEFVKTPLFLSDDFGGCSVTIPHKQAIIPYVDVLSESAKAIESVNTLVVKGEFVDDEFKRFVYGDNTDWKGIFNPLDRHLAGTVNTFSDYALVLGAGGTARAAAYAATKLGLKRVYYNRTPSKAADVADTFGGTVLASLEQSGAAEGMSLGEALGPEGVLRVVISTLPAAASFELPDWAFTGIKKPIIFDVNYKPYNTKLLLQAELHGCTVVRGSEMLWNQGVGQFELWTERSAPYRIMKEVVLSNCQET